MKKREEIEILVDIPEWAETILDLHNLELYIFSEIYSCFRNRLKGFEVYDYYTNFNAIIKYFANRFDYSEGACSTAIKHLKEKQLIISYKGGTTYQEIKLIKPNIPYLEKVLTENGVSKDEFIYRVDLGNYTYTVPAETLFYYDKLDSYGLKRLNGFYIDYSLIAELGVSGIDLLILSEVFTKYGVINSYKSTSEELKYITGLTEDELKIHLSLLCESGILFATVDTDKGISYHINTELYNTIKFLNYVEQRRQEANTNE